MFRKISAEGFVIDGAGAADVFRAGARGEKNRLADVRDGQAQRHGDAAQVHADQGTADVKPGVRADLLEDDRLTEGAICRGGEGAARFRLRNDIDPVVRVLHGGALDDDRAVQMLTALRGKIDSFRIKDRGERQINDLSSLGRRKAPDRVPEHLARRTADDDDVSGHELCRGAEFFCRFSRFIFDFQ